MTLNDLRAYLNNSSMETTDTVVIKTADGTEHAIQSIVRFNGDEQVYPASASNAPTVVIQLAS